ncbi:hypothetical protein [Paenibacillus elgii]|uniref:hypothetical protein n=1 Tax=Paenibacillus elgii TaxID=189691 RepID=UPI0013D730A3|nr:hypothetical protein [Paenibacillus elgii]
MNIGRRIYYDSETGKMILDTGERSGSVEETSVEEDFESYSVLKTQLRETICVLQLNYGDYANEFASCSSVRVNPETLKLEFS